jgi:NTP pyrophosphatase (non-canonical NTP hydrolase)
MSIEKEDVVNALKVLATMLKYAKLNTHDVAELMITELEGVEFVPASQPGEPVKFHKTFEALYSTAMNMADNCIGNKTIEARFDKLEEEYQELIEAFGNFKKLVPTRTTENTEYYDPNELKKVWEDITNEMADVLFVLLHIGHKSGEATAFDLLHRAAYKMLGRMNDNNYKAKI